MNKITVFEPTEKYLSEHGALVRGVWKQYIGKVLPDPKTGAVHLGRDTLGYHFGETGDWVVFVTDSERGLPLEGTHCKSEEEALALVFEIAERAYYIRLCDEVADHFDEKEPVILAYLSREYGYSKEKAEKALAYLKQKRFIAVEFWYYVEYQKFLPHRYAAKYCGYTAEMLSERDDLTVLGAFNYLVYLARNPQEALEDLQNGLPRK